MCAFLVNAQTIVFNETFGNEGPTANPRAKIDEYSDWDNRSPVTFTYTTTDYADIRATSSINTHVWFPANRETDLVISNISTAGYTNLKLSFDIACNNAGGDAGKVTLTCNGVTITVPSTPVGTVNRYVSSGELSIPDADVTNLRFLYTEVNNPYGYRLDNIKITATGDDGGGDEGGGSIDPNITAYYQSAVGKAGAELKAALHNIIKNHTTYSYSSLWEHLSYTDEDPDNTNNVILLYTGWSYPKSNHGGNVTEWNREHTWAKSQGNFGETEGPGTDLHHLRPTDVSVNSKRGNLMFDNGGTPYTDPSRYGGGDGTTGCKVDGDSFEPADRVKGDVARMLFYMAVRYEGTSNNDPVDLELAETSSSSGKHGKLSTLLQWNRTDLVNDWEIRRNNRTQELQNNRNPFIDYPELAEYIWGNKVGSTWGLASGLNETIAKFTVSYNSNENKLIICTKEPKSMYTIYSINGQSLQTGIVTSGNTSISSDYFQNGMYLIQMQSGSRQAVQKFIVTR